MLLDFCDVILNSPFSILYSLFSKVAITDVELQNAKEERDQAIGDLADSANRDVLLAKAQSERDSANERRTKAEIELAKTRIELMQANSQLLESIQQKVELSQQLEQWQVSFIQQSIPIFTV